MVKNSTLSKTNGPISGPEASAKPIKNVVDSYFSFKIDIEVLDRSSNVLKRHLKNKCQYKTSKSQEIKCLNILWRNTIIIKNDSN
jgi:hypothetical protein